MPPVTVIDDFGDAHTLEGEALRAALDNGWTIESEESAADRVAGDAEKKAYSGVADTIDAYAAGVARVPTVGGSDILLSALGGKRRLQKLKEHQPIATAAGELVGGLSGGELAAVGKVGALARAKEGASALRTIGSAARAGAIEGAVTEVGAGVSDLQLSDDPVTMDRIASSLSNRFLYGGAIGGVAGGALGSLEAGLRGARRKLDAVKGATTKADGVPDDLAGLDRKGLRNAEKAELEAIETGRVPERAKVADEIVAMREAGKVEQPWVAIEFGARGSEAAKGAPRWAREAKKIGFDADKAIDRLLRDPKGLAADPKLAAKALRQQEHALEQIAKHADELKVHHAADSTGRRAAALEMVTPALERNRALQQRIADLTSPASSLRLTQITDAADMLGTARTKTLGEQMAGGAAYGLAADLVRMIPVVGPLAAPLVGARIADMVTGQLGTRLAAVTREATERATRAVDAFLTVTRRAERVAPIVATKVLEHTRFSPAPLTSKREEKKTPATLEDHFEERANELAAAVEPGLDGRPKVRADVRQQIAGRLSPIASMSPHVADRLETHAVRRMEFLAARLPKATQIGMTRIRPAEMAIRAWARYVAAADDPGGIEERLADGTVTPEDAEVMRELYPDRMAEIVRMIAERLPTLRATLPYHRRLALSIFTNQPVDAAMDPAILSVLQASFDEEEGSEAGTQAPRPQPAFGSVKKSVPAPTPAQERAG